MLVDDDQSWILHPFTASHLEFSRIMHCGLKLPFFSKGFLIQKKAQGEFSSTGRGELDSVLSTGFLQNKLKASTLVCKNTTGTEMARLREIHTEREH